MIHGVSPKQQYLIKMRLTRHTVCLCCSSEDADASHIISCKELSKTAVSVFAAEVTKSMKGLKEDDELLEQIIDSTRHTTNCIDPVWNMEVQSETLQK